jgi:hypothetical protein
MKATSSIDIVYVARFLAEDAQANVSQGGPNPNRTGCESSSIECSRDLGVRMIRLGQGSSDLAPLLRQLDCSADFPLMSQNDLENLMPTLSGGR